MRLTKKETLWFNFLILGFMSLFIISLILTSILISVKDKYTIQKETIDSLNSQVENYKLLYKLGE